MSNLKKNIILNSLYQVLAILVPVVLTPYLTRTLGSEGLGSYSYYFSCAYYFSLFAMLGYSVYGNRSIAKVNDDKQKRTVVFWEIYILQLITTGIMMLLYVFFMLFFQKNNKIVWCLGGYVLACAFDISWFFFGMEKFKVTVSRNLFIKVITVVCSLWMIKTEDDVYVYAAIISLGTLFANLSLFFQIPKYINWFKYKELYIWKHIKPSLVLFIPYLAVSLYKVMDKVMLGMMSNMNEVGYYESSERIINLPMAFITALGTVMLPRISNMVHNDDKEKSKVYLQKSLEFTMFLSGSMCFGVIAVANEFVPLFFGKGFEKCVGLLTVLMPSCLFLAFANVIRTQYLIPHEMDKQYVTSLLLGAAVNFAANWMMIPRYESIGAGIGTLLAEAAVCICQCLSVRKYIGLGNCVKKVLPYVFAGIIMCFCVINLGKCISVIPMAMLVIKVLAGVVLYMVLVCLFTRRFPVKEVRKYLKKEQP